MNLIQRNHQKLLILDVDGVLNNDVLLSLPVDQRTSFLCSEQDFLAAIENHPLKKRLEWRLKCDFHQINKSSIELLNELFELEPFDILLSSTWRTTMELEIFDAFMKAIGLKAATIAFTDDFNNRDLEIKTWLKENGVVNSFAIVDDDTSIFQGEIISRVVKTTFALGLCREHLKEILKRFRNEN